MLLFMHITFELRILKRIVKLNVPDLCIHCTVYYLQSQKQHLYLPCPHEWMIVGICRGQDTEYIIIRALRLLALHSFRAVIPRIVDHHSSIMEADAQHKWIV